MRLGLVILAALLMLGAASTIDEHAPEAELICYGVIRDVERGVIFALCLFPISDGEVSNEPKFDI